jgi:hypothetical protein
MQKVVITSMPIQFHSYYQWFVLGLYELENKNEIAFKWRLPIYQFAYYFLLNNYLRREGYRFLSKYKILKNESYALTGYFKDSDGNKKYFAFDIADSPYVFDEKILSKTTIYFKAQCPINIDSKGFKLTNEMYIPFAKYVLNYKDKIKPAMLGPRRLSWSFKFEELKKSYLQYLSFQTATKKGKLMCYFGGAKGPAVTPNKVLDDNFDGEGKVMGHFANQLQHPNEKRYLLFRIIRKMGAICDARVINKSGVVDTEEFLTKDAPVPLKDFTKHVANFQYNANVSGFRLSIPNRFIESFMVGTAIVTDELAVKWYTPFKEEVVELPVMGYLPNDQVNWMLIEQQVNQLKDVQAAKVIEQYNNNWAPLAFATYIVQTLQTANQ